MESTTRFSLDQHIAIWRSELAGSGNLNREDLDELECHLRDEVDQLSTCQVSSKEAFMIAQDRIGSSRDLAIPFAQSKSLWSLFITRSPRYLQTLLLLTSVSMCTRLVEFTTVGIVSSFVLPIAWGYYIYTGLLLTLLTAMFFGFRYLFKKSRKPGSKISLTAGLTIALVMLATLALLAATQFVGSSMSSEIASVFTFRQYIWAGGFLLLLLIAIVYSIKDSSSLRMKTA